MSEVDVCEKEVSVSSTVIELGRATRNIQTVLSILPTAGQHKYTDGEKTNIPIQTSLTILPEQSNTDVIPLFMMKPEERTIMLWKKSSQGDGLRDPEDIYDSYDLQQLLDECSNNQEKEMTLTISTTIEMLSKQLFNLKAVYEQFLITNRLEEIEKKSSIVEVDDDHEVCDEEKPRKVSIQITDISLSCFNLEKLSADADEFPMNRTYDPIEDAFVPARNIITFRETFPMPKNASTIAMFEDELGNGTSYDFTPPEIESPHPRVMFDTDIGRPVPFYPLCICEREIQAKCPGGCNYFEVWGTLPLEDISYQVPLVESFCPPRAMFDYDLGGIPVSEPSLRDRIVRPGGAMLDVDLIEVELPVLCTCKRVEDPKLKCNCDLRQYLLSSWSAEEITCDICQKNTLHNNIGAMFDTDLLRDIIVDEISLDRNVSYGKKPAIKNKKIVSDPNEIQELIDPVSDPNEVQELIVIDILDESEFIFDVKLLTESDITPMWDTDLGQSAIPFDTTDDDTESIDSLKNERPMFDYDLLGASRPEPPFQLRRVIEGGAMFDVDIGIVPDVGNQCICLLHMLPNCICGCLFYQLFDELGIIQPEEKDLNICTDEASHVKRPMYDYDLLGVEHPPGDPKFRHVFSGGAMFDSDLLYVGDFKFYEVAYNANMRSHEADNVVSAMFDYNLYGGTPPDLSGSSLDKQKGDTEKESYKVGPMFDTDLSFEVQGDDVKVDYEENQSDTDEVMFDYNLLGFVNCMPPSPPSSPPPSPPSSPPPSPPPYDYKKIELCNPMFDSDLGREILVTSLCKCDQEWDEECPCGCKYYELYKEITAQQKTNQVHKVSSIISNLNERAMFDYDLHGGQRIERTPISVVIYDPDQDYIGLDEVCNPCMYDTDLGHLVRPKDRTDYLAYYGDDSTLILDNDDSIELIEVDSDDRAMFDYHLYGGIKPKVVAKEERRVVEGGAMFDSDLGHFESEENENANVIDIELLPTKPRGMFDYDLLGATPILDCDECDCEKCDCKPCKSKMKSEKIISGESQDVPQAEPQDVSQAEPQDVPQAEPQDVPQGEPQDVPQNEPLIPEIPNEKCVCEKCECEKIVSTLLPPEVILQSQCEEKPFKTEVVIPKVVEKSLKLNLEKKVATYVDPADPCKCRKENKPSLKLTYGGIKCLCQNIFMDRKQTKQCPAKSGKYQQPSLFSKGVSIPASSYKIQQMLKSGQNEYQIPAKTSKITNSRETPSRMVQGFDQFDDITLSFTEKKRTQQSVVRQTDSSSIGRKQGSIASTASSHTHRTVETHSSVVIKLQPSRSKTMANRRRYPLSSTSIKRTPSVYQCDVSHRFAPFVTGPLVNQFSQAPVQGVQDNVTIVLAEHRPHRVGHRHKKTTGGSHKVQLRKPKKQPVISPVVSTNRSGQAKSLEKSGFILGSTAVTSDPNDFPFFH